MRMISVLTIPGSAALTVILRDLIRWAKSSVNRVMANLELL